MPDRLDAKKLAYFKNVLLKMKAQLQGDIRGMADENVGDQGDKGDLSGHAMHMADVATDMYDREFNMALAAKDRHFIQRIEDALMRIDKGTYGVCLKTGKRISEARLRAVPYTEYCIEAQEEMDRQKK